MSFDAHYTERNVPSKTYPGWTFKVEQVPDIDADPPWESDCGSVDVERRRGHHSGDGYVKGAGEVIIHEDRGTVWVVDFAAEVKRARAEGWGLSPGKDAEVRLNLVLSGLTAGQRATTTLAEAKALADCLTLTKGRKAVAAVLESMDRSARWMRNQWHYIGVVVSIDGAPDGWSFDPEETQSLWGVEDDATDHIAETAEDLGAELVRALKGRGEGTRALPNGMQVPTPPLTQDELLDLRKQAVTLYNTGLGDPTIEVEADAAVTLTEDGCPEPGAWVQAWVYVPFERAKVS